MTTGEEGISKTAATEVYVRHEQGAGMQSVQQQDGGIDYEAHQDGAALELDAIDHLRRQVHGLAGAVVEAAQPVFDAVHLHRTARPEWSESVRHGLQQRSTTADVVQRKTMLACCSCEANASVKLDGRA